MATIRVTGVQMEVRPTKKENHSRILNLIEHGDCDIVVFPEMALTGYNNDFSDARTAEAWNDIAAMCRKAYTTAIVGTGARFDGHPHIQARIFGDDGEVIGTHEKLVPTQADRAWARPGEELRVFNKGDLIFGCLCGNDLWVAPGFGPYTDHRLSYQLAKNHGAQVIFHLNHSGTDPQYKDYYEANLRLRAKEAGCPIVTVNACVPTGEINSASGVIGADGKWMKQLARVGEHHFTVDLEVE
jgi:predicted amidohydrolase